MDLLSQQSHLSAPKRPKNPGFQLKRTIADETIFGADKIYASLARTLCWANIVENHWRNGPFTAGDCIGNEGKVLRQRAYETISG